MNEPFAYFAISFSLGIYFSSVVKVPVIHYLGLSAMFSISTFLCLRNRIVFHIALCIALFFFGALSYQAARILPADHISKIILPDGETIHIKGDIVNDTEEAGFILNICAIKKGGIWRDASGKVLVRRYSAGSKRVKLNFGDRVVLKGVIKKPREPAVDTGLFNYAKYLELKNIYFIFTMNYGYVVGTPRDNIFRSVKKAAYSIRHKVSSMLDEYFEPLTPDNGFLKSILIGKRRGLDRDIEEDFVRTGTVHLLSISGTHVGLIGCALLYALGWAGIRKKPALILTLLCLAFYSIIAGLSPPIVRSTIMYSLFAMGYIINRRSDMANSLSITGFMMLLCNPNALFDTSFQLSFGSLAGIALISPKIDDILMVNASIGHRAISRVLSCLLKSVSISTAAWAGTAPIVATYFYIVSPIAVIANLIAIPLVFAAMILSALFLISITGAIFITPLLAHLIRAVDNALFFANNIFSRIPFSHFYIPPPSPLFTVFYYILIILLILSVRRKYILILALIFLNVLVWDSSIRHKKSVLKVTYLDRGRGKLAFIEFPRKGCLIFDGDAFPNQEAFDASRSIVAPYLWKKGINRIDAIITSRRGDDRSDRLAYILKNFAVGCIIDAEPGDEITGYDGARLFVMPSPRNKASIVLKLNCGTREFIVGTNGKN